MDIIYLLRTENIALAASAPFLVLAFACFMFKHVKIPFPIGFLKLIDKSIIALIAAEEIKSKCGVCPLITHPKAINASYFLIFFEIPVTISKNLKKFDGFLALGCVIKGQTPHFDFISQASTDAIMKLSIDSKKPIGNGIITCLNMAQARARRKKGAEAAEAVISVLSQK